MLGLDLQWKEDLSSEWKILLWLVFQFYCLYFITFTLSVKLFALIEIFCSLYFKYSSTNEKKKITFLITETCWKRPNYHETSECEICDVNSADRQTSIGFHCKCHSRHISTDYLFLSVSNISGYKNMWKPKSLCPTVTKLKVNVQLAGSLQVV